MWVPTRGPIRAIAVGGMVSSYAAWFVSKENRTRKTAFRSYCEHATSEK